MNYYHEKRYKISKKISFSNALHNKLNNRTFIKVRACSDYQVKKIGEININALIAVFHKFLQ